MSGVISPVGLDTGLPGWQESVPQSHVPPVLTVAGSGQQGGAAALEDEVRRVPVVSLQVEEGRGGVGSLGIQTVTRCPHIWTLGTCHSAVLPSPSQTPNLFPC